MLIVNKRVAVTPFETTQTKMEVKGGLPNIKQKVTLTKLTVVYESACGFDSVKLLQAGDTVLVRGESCKHDFAKQVFEVEDGKPFILLPVEFIVGVE